MRKIIIHTESRTSGGIMVKVKECTYEDLEQKLSKRPFICFGQGEKFHEFLQRFPDIERLKAIINNYKTDDYFEYGGKKLPVYSINEIICSNIELDKILIIITSLRNAKEMITQLDLYREFKGAECYIPEIVALHADDVLPMPLTTEEKIPRTIHYFWFGPNEMPDQFKKNIESWYKYCPDYKIILWNEKNYDISKCSYMEQAYRAKKWGFVPDYARIDVVNTYGGNYLDTDVELVKPLDSLLRYSMFCGFESGNLANDFINFGQGFGSVSNSKILQDMMDDYKRQSFINEDGSLNLVASPVYQTRILKKYGLKADGRTQRGNGFVALSSEYLSPFDTRGNGKVTDKTISIHQYAATWMEKSKLTGRKIVHDQYKWIQSRINGEG